MIFSILIFVALLLVLVLIHEWGHFFAARRLGVRVDEFAFGFPPRIASITRGGVRYAFNLLPLGGYVKIYGEGGEGEHDRKSFAGRPVWQRFVIIIAGVVMNFVLAWFLFTVVQLIGLPQVVADDANVPFARVTIVEVAPQSPAKEADLRQGDAILELRAFSETITVASVDDVQNFIRDHTGEEIYARISRGQGEIVVTFIPRANPPEGQGAVGIAMATTAVVRSSLLEAPLNGLRVLASATVLTLGALRDLALGFLQEGKVSEEVSGPVGIFFIASDTWQLGLSYFLFLAGALSLNLAIFNILPIPALDGGRVLFLFIEKIKGTKVNQKYEQIVHAVGLVVLLVLVALLTYRDIIMRVG